MTRQLSLRLPASLLDEIDRRARRRRRSRAEVIRAALTMYLELPEGAFDRAPIERVRDLLGSVADLPTDVASNPTRYLTDLGRRR